MPNAEPSNALIITGMHRSGTSMTTRLLNLCGLHLGDRERLLRARPDNPAGFWENLDFVTLDDRILTSLGAGWDLPPTESVDPARLEAFAPAARRCIESASAGATDLWGWKDPRCSLLLPFWTAHLATPRVVVCLRHPLEVAASLSKRNGFSRQLGLKLWLAYQHRLEEDLAALPRVQALVTHYDALMRHPRRELQRLTRWLGWSTSDEVLKEATASIRADLRHHDAQPLPPDAPAGLEAMYERWCEKAGPNLTAEATADPDRIAEGLRQGERRYAAGDFSAAVDAFRKVLRLDAACLRARNNLACALWATGRQDDAIFEAVGALKSDPDDADATWNLSQFLHHIGRTGEAAELLENYLQRHPGAREVSAELQRWSTSRLA